MVSRALTYSVLYSKLFLHCSSFKERLACFVRDLQSPGFGHSHARINLTTIMLLDLTHPHLVLKIVTFNTKQHLHFLVM